MKILIADDHWVVRQSLKQVLRRLNKAQEVLEAATFDEVLVTLRNNPDTDLMLADLVMPGLDEFQGLQKLQAEFPNVPVVVVSIHEDREHVLRAVEHGAIGYIPKSSSGIEIEKAFERILAGEVYFPRRLIAQTSGVEPSPQPSATVPRSAEQDRLASLTQRELEVIGLLGKGYSIQRISVELEISSHTVRVHLTNLMKKLGLSDRSETIHFAVNLANGNFSASQ